MNDAPNKGNGKMETKIEINENGITVIVKIKKAVEDDIAYVDGHNINLGKMTYEETHIEVKKGAHHLRLSDLSFFYVISEGQRSASRAYARFGDNYLSREVYEMVDGALAKAQTESKAAETAEYAELKKREAEQAAERSVRAADADNHGFGYCHKCQSYCFGDCEA